nr:cytochrome P450 CYP82H23-like [Quercus suber]POE66940.1 cytochrome p450 82c4 [Quercus suber]
MADKYRPIFTIWLGVHRTLVVSSWETAKECFTTNDKAFANRPKALDLELLGYNYAMFGFSPYDPYWRQMRKMTMLEVLSNHRPETLKHIREQRMVVRKRFGGAMTKDENEGNDNCRKALRDFFHLSGTFVVSDALP